MIQQICKSNNVDEKKQKQKKKNIHSNLTYNNNVNKIIHILIE